MIIFRVYANKGFHGLFCDLRDVAAFLESLPCEELEDFEVEAYNAKKKTAKGDVVSEGALSGKSFLTFHKTLPCEKPADFLTFYELGRMMQKLLEEK